MKSFSLFVLASICMVNYSFAQVDTLKTSYDYLKKKRNTYNTLGWVSLGTGTTLILVGAAVAAGDVLSPNSSNRSEIIADIGLVAALGSIPLFLVAHKYKKKARLALKNEHSFLLNGDIQRYPALSLKIQL